MVKVIEVLVGQQPEVKEIEKSPFAHVKELLGGDACVQVVTLDDGVEVYSDEEGMYTQEFNRVLTTRAAPLPEGFDMSDVINYDESMAKPGEMGEHRMHGAFVLARHDHRKDEPMSLTEDDIAKWMFNLTLPT